MKHFNRKYIYLIFVLILIVIVFFIAYYFEKSNVSQRENVQNNTNVQWTKGYDLPVDDMEKEEACTECEAMLKLIYDIYVDADKGTSSNAVLSEDTISQMQQKIKETGYAVTTSKMYSDMENYVELDSFLNDCVNGESGSVVLYNVMNNGGIGRRKFIYDGSDMYVVAAKAMWNEAAESYIEYVSYTRIKEWRYTDKGWFCYELCVPEYPEVTEMVDGSRLLRVQPMQAEYRELSEKYVMEIGYQGNNLLCSDWDVNNLDTLNYNGIYEYFYKMKYDEAFSNENYSDGIPKDEFESLIMEYLPVTKEQIQEYAMYDIQNEKYLWERNYAPTFFATSIPEVTSVKYNEDGTITLTVDAVCEMVLCDDAVITHELTVRILEGGRFQYISNNILNDDIEKTLYK